MPVTNLRELCGSVFVIRDDGTDDSERAERVWCLTIPAVYGEVYPCGNNGDLAVWTASQRIARKLAALGLRVVQRGDEVAFRFPPARLDEVARIIQARRRRRVSPEQAAILAARLRAARSKAVSSPEERTSWP